MVPQHELKKGPSLKECSSYFELEFTTFGAEVLKMKTAKMRAPKAEISLTLVSVMGQTTTHSVLHLPQCIFNRIFSPNNTFQLNLTNQPSHQNKCW